jgi:hypothetical protein
MSRSRSAYGLDAVADDQMWKRRGLCGLDPDLWFSGEAAGRNLAVHICNRHCPVRGDCSALLGRLVTAGEPPQGQVMAGIPFSAHRRQMRVGPSARCRHCRTSDG